MPSEPILDSHVHIWHPERMRIPWLDSIPSLNQAMWLDDYAAATQGLDIEGFVYLQVEVAPPYALIEATEIVKLSRQNPLVRGVVPWAPLEFGDRCKVFLQYLTAIGSEIKGVRRIVQDEPDPEYCLQPDFVRGNQLLAEFGLSSDLCCNYRQLAANVELVRRCPQTQFIMDHIAKPGIRDDGFQPWADQMRELASLPNCCCKVSGVVTEADHDAWTIEDVKPFVLHTLDVFGEDRVAFGSDWPVVTLASSYALWVETLDTLTYDLSEQAKRKLWHDNAFRFYRLDS
jgi:predicted TIM-barrel fold metal-dependent hydrolase